MHLTKTMQKIIKISQIGFKPSLTSAALLVLGGVAFALYDGLVNYFSTHMKFHYFLEPMVLLSTSVWILGVLLLGYLFNFTFLLNAHLQGEALEKIKEIDA